jgi:hypothetical protein
MSPIHHELPSSGLLLKGIRVVRFAIQQSARARASAVVKALYYKPERCGFETPRSELFLFSTDLILPATLGPAVYSASKRNQYPKQKNNVSGE